MNKAHPYTDGNKRFAVAAMEYFLYLNMAALFATDREVEDFALGVADRRYDLEACTSFVVRRTGRLNWSETQVTRWFGRMGPEERDSVRGIIESEPFVRGNRIHQGVVAILEGERH